MLVDLTPSKATCADTGHHTATNLPRGTMVRTARDSRRGLLTRPVSLATCRSTASSFDGLHHHPRLARVDYLQDLRLTPTWWTAPSTSMAAPAAVRSAPEPQRAITRRQRACARLWRITGGTMVIGLTTISPCSRSTADLCAPGGDRRWQEPRAGKHADRDDRLAHHFVTRRVCAPRSPKDDDHLAARQRLIFRR